MRLRVPHSPLRGPSLPSPASKPVLAVPAAQDTDPPVLPVLTVSPPSKALPCLSRVWSRLVYWPCPSIQQALHYGGSKCEFWLPPP